MGLSRPAGLRLIATVLGILGTATLLAYLAIPFGRTPLPDVDSIAVSLGLLCGVLALASARQLWWLRPGAPKLFLTWAAATAAFNALPRNPCSRTQESIAHSQLSACSRPCLAQLPARMQCMLNRRLTPRCSCPGPAAFQSTSARVPGFARHALVASGVERYTAGSPLRRARQLSARSVRRQRLWADSLCPCCACSP